MSQPPMNNPGARYWDDLMEEFDFSPDEQREIREGADQMIAEVGARRLAEIRCDGRQPGPRIPHRG